MCQFDSRDAPLLMWQTRRSVARQLLSGVAFLHKTGVGPLCRIFHGNLKPSNVLLKNGIVKISEVNCFSTTVETPSHGAVPRLRHSVSLRNFGTAPAASGTLASHRALAALQQAEFAPLLTEKHKAEIAECAVRATSAGAYTIAARELVAAAEPVVTPPVIPPSTLSVDGRLHLLALLHGTSKVELASSPGTPASSLTPSNSSISSMEHCPSFAGSEKRLAARSSTLAEADRAYRLASYGDAFALGCLIYFTLTLGRHPFGTLTTGPEAIGTASANIARGFNPSTAALSAELLAAAREANKAVTHFVERLQEGVTVGCLKTPAVPVTGSAEPPAPSGSPSSENTSSSSRSSSSGTGAADASIGTYVAAARRNSATLGPLPPVPPVVAESPPSLRRPSGQTLAPAADTLDYEEAADLVSGLLSPDLSLRLTPAVALKHPFFWRVTQKFLLITLVSETVVVQQDRAFGEHAAFATDLQACFLSRLPRGASCSAEANSLIPPPPPHTHYLSPALLQVRALGGRSSHRHQELERTAGHLHCGHTVTPWDMSVSMPGPFQCTVLSAGAETCTFMALSTSAAGCSARTPSSKRMFLAPSLG
jgi:serine/threonine protein kinase